MNTKQLITIWYTVIGLLSLLIFSGGKVVPFHLNEWSAIAISIASIGFLTVYTMKASHQLDKRTFLRWVVPSIAAPIIVVLGLLVVNYRPTETLSESEKAQVKLEREPTVSDSTIYANVYNGSSYDINELVVIVTAKDSQQWEDAPSDLSTAKPVHPNVPFDPDKYLEGKIREKTLWSRKYKTTSNIESFSTGMIRLPVFISGNYTFDYEVSEVKGKKAK